MPPNAIDIEFNNIQNLPASLQGGNISEDPMFADPAGPDGDPSVAEDNDYRLTAGSPSIDAADARFSQIGAPFTDVLTNRLGQDPRDAAGETRAVSDPLTIEPFGLAVYGLYTDQGAFEYQPLFSPDLNEDGIFDLTDIVLFLDGIERFKSGN
jgi:hypothetical protein